MPPRIFISGIRAINPPEIKPTFYGSDAWILAEFPAFSAEVTSVYSYFNIVFPSAPEVSFTSTNDSIDITMPAFGASLQGAGGSIASFNAGFASFTGSFLSSQLALNADAIAITASGICYTISKIAVAADTITISVSGVVEPDSTIIEPITESSSEDELAALFTGENYIIVNLKTKAHSTYRDGNNNALAQTGELTFSSEHNKNVSDVYLSSRSTGDILLTTKSGEDIERTQTLRYGVNGQANLINKKVVLSKGIKAKGWQFSILSPEGSHCEVSSIDLIVNKLKRRV